MKYKYIKHMVKYTANVHCCSSLRILFYFQWQKGQL